MKISVENGKICNQTTTGERMERIGEVWIVDERDCLRVDFIEKMEGRFREHHPRYGSSTQEKVESEISMWLTAEGMRNSHGL